MDEDYYESPIPLNLCDPEEVVPLVEDLEPLYKKNGETFEDHAFSFLMLLLNLVRPAKEFVFFLLACNDFPNGAITTEQALKYSHFNEEDDFNSDHDLLEGIVKRIERFNALLIKNDSEKIDSRLYFIVLRKFLLGKIIDGHFEVFELYSDEFPDMPANRKLGLLNRATDYPVCKRKVVLLPDSKELDVEQSDPFSLFQTIKLYDPKKMPGINKALSLFEKQFLKRHIPRLAIKVLRAHFLSPLPNNISAEHVSYVIDRIRSLKHPFTIGQKLHIFYEFLSLEQKRAQIHYSVEIIKLLEVFVGTQMSPGIVTKFLCFHPNLTDVKLRQVRLHLDRLSELRTLLMKKGVLDLPRAPVQTVSDIVNITSELLLVLRDNSRRDALLKEGVLSEHLFGTLQQYIYFASIPLTVTYVTRVLPSVNEQVGSPNQALMPLNPGVDLGKLFYASWEGENVLYFSLVAEENKTTYSDRVALGISKEVLTKNQDLPLMIKTFVHDVGYDGGDSEPRVSFDTVEWFFSHPKVEPIWTPFQPVEGNKGEIGIAIYRFCVALRVALRKAFFYLATNKKYAKAEQSSNRIETNHLPIIAARGDIFSRGICHIIVPFELVEGSKNELVCYGTYTETQFLLDRENTRVDDALKFYPIEYSHDTLLNIAIHDTPHRFPLKITGKKTVIDFDDREYKWIDGEPDFYKGDAYEITLSTEVNLKPVTVRVVYPAKNLYPKDNFQSHLSWQIALLKSRVYAIIIEKLKMLQDHH